MVHEAARKPLKLVFSNSRKFQHGTFRYKKEERMSVLKRKGMLSQRRLGVCLRQFFQQFAGTGIKPIMCKNRKLLPFNSSRFQAHPSWLGSNTNVGAPLLPFVSHYLWGKKMGGHLLLEKPETLNELAFSMQESVPFNKRPIRPLVDSHSFSESYKHILLTSLCRIGPSNNHQAYWTIIILPKRVLHSLQFPSFTLLRALCYLDRYYHRLNILVSRFSIREFSLFKSVSSFVERSYSQRIFQILETKTQPINDRDGLLSFQKQT